MNHAYFIRRCLQLAKRGRGSVGNGALVGCVLVRNEKIIAEGLHEGFGKAHAERQLLQKFDQNISSDDVLYVSLEPCIGHPSKKNPPCVELLVERGIRQVICGMRDPDPRVAGKGISLLRSKGVRVMDACLPEECARLNRGFVCVRMKQRPWITLKSARTIDGKTANDDGSPMAITSDEQNRWSHEFLRAAHDAIMVGVGTVIADNPQLNNKFVQNSSRLYRVILDPMLRIPLDARVLTDQNAPMTIVIAAQESIEQWSKKAEQIRSSGARIMTVEIDANGGIILGELWKRLLTPEKDYHGITSILLEGGRKTWEIFRAAGVVDEEVTLVGSD